jgi:hypothetical protein
MIAERRDAVRNALVTSIALVAFVAPASAQQPTAQQREVEARERQQLVQYMEDLKGAVSAGASSMLRQVRRESPRAELGMANPIEVEYFRLEDGGLLFRVRVPTMLPTLRYAMELDRARRAERTVTTTSLVTTPAPSATAATVPALPAPPNPFVDIDPDAVYTKEVKAQLLNTFLVRSTAIRIPPDRFLTVAARDDGRPDPTLPSSSTEFNTVYLSITGRDLASFHEGRQSLDETQKLVIVREE